MKRIFKWLKADKYMDTEYGNITTENWCKKEAKRIGNCCVKTKKNFSGTFCAVFKKGVYERENIS